MKRILLISSIFPPQSAIGGLRIALFAKHLESFGMEVWVISRTYGQSDERYDEDMLFPLGIPEHRIIRVEHSVLDEQKYREKRGFLGLVRDFFYPEYSEPAGLFHAMWERSYELCLNVSFDFVLGTVPDQECLTIASRLKKRFKFTYIADFRDIIEQDRGLDYTFRDRLQRTRFLLRRYLTTRNSDYCLTISEYHASLLRRKLRKKVKVIYNGFDEDFFGRQIGTVSSDSPFTIIYTGRILDIWYRDPSVLFFAIDELIQEKKIASHDIVVRFYGSDEKKLAPITSKMSSTEFLEFKERIAYSEVPVTLSSANILLLLTNKGRKGILTTKMFEYIGMRKPILCVPGDGYELDLLIRKNNLGYVFDDKMELKKSLLYWISQHKSKKWSANLNGDVSIFSRMSQSKELFNLLQELNG